MESMESQSVRWTTVMAAALVCLSAVASVRAGESGDDDSEHARSSSAATGGTAESALRSPADVRDGAVEFSGDLEPIGDDRVRPLLKTVCPTTLEQTDQGGWRCGRCPGFTSNAGEPGELTLEQTIRGNFFHKKRPELFTTYSGCEDDHAAGGGAIVFRRRKKEWRVFYRHPGLNPQQCLVFEADKHPDRLVCRVRANAGGRVIEHIYGTGGDGGGLQRLVHAIDNTAKCPDKKFISSYLANWKRQKADKQGHETLVIEKIQRWRPLGKNRKSACTLSEAGGSWKRHRRLEIVYRFDGEGLERTEVRKQSLGVEGNTKTASTEANDDETKTD